MEESVGGRGRVCKRVNHWAVNVSASITFALSAWSLSEDTSCPSKSWCPPVSLLYSRTPLSPECCISSLTMQGAVHLCVTPSVCDSLVLTCIPVCVCVCVCVHQVRACATSPSLRWQRGSSRRRRPTCAEGCRWRRERGRGRRRGAVGGRQRQPWA